MSGCLCWKSLAMTLPQPVATAAAWCLNRDSRGVHVKAVRRQALVRCEALIRAKRSLYLQQPRNLALILGERLVTIRFLIRDRGSNFTASFDAVFQAAGTKILRTAVQTPRMNAICERLVGTLCRELPDRVLIPREAKLSRPVLPPVTYDGSLPASARRK